MNVDKRPRGTWKQEDFPLAHWPSSRPLCSTATKLQYYYILISWSRHVCTTHSYSSPLKACRRYLNTFGLLQGVQFSEPSPQHWSQRAGQQHRAPAAPSPEGWKAKGALQKGTLLFSRSVHVLTSSTPSSLWNLFFLGPSQARCRTCFALHTMRCTFPLPTQSTQKFLRARTDELWDFLPDRKVPAFKNPQAPTAPSTISSSTRNRSPDRCPPAQPPKQPHQAHSLPKNQMPPEPSPF